MEEVNAYEKEIAFLSKKILDLNNKLIDSEKDKSKFLSLIATQLNHPMNVLLEIIPHLKAQVCDKNKELVSLISQEFFNLKFKITNIITATQIESGTIQPACAMANLCEILDDILESLHHIIKERNITINIEDKIKKAIVTDPYLVCIIIKNLVSNAVVFADENSEVKVSFETEDSLLKISVENKGKGPQTKFKPEVFTRFAKTPNQEHGLGIGLSIVNELCILLDGSVDYTVAENVVTFYVTFKYKDRETDVAACGSGDFLLEDLKDAIEL